ncbi:unnamed protein product [Prorocentrum cordatum]|uniref:Uncharacterized protein n=1 Tax=Prorocentrum cordatum TaxID=2364126 RepID=A0ABN9QWJ8_9DINO|nr:unnamed protein product [Polarella glacialis]
MQLVKKLTATGRLQDWHGMVCPWCAGGHITGNNHKLIESTYARLGGARVRYVQQMEKTIKSGAVDEWPDVEAEEADLGKENDVAVSDKDKPVRRDWKPIAQRHPARRHVVLHADGARTYKMKFPGVLHDNVVHMKREIVRQGGTFWLKPKFSEVVDHELPSGVTLRTKSGTQIIDRFWAHLREHLQSRTRRVGTHATRRRIRSAQWTFWNKGQELWSRTGDMLKALY